MITIIFILIISGISVYLSQSNLTPVTVHVGPYAFMDIPLFYVIIGSLLTGLVLAYVMHLIQTVFVGFSMRKKDTKIKQAKNEIAELTKQVHKLEIENEKLKNTPAGNDPDDSNAL